jgi:hypothetical protein
LFRFKEVYDKGFEAIYALFDALQQAMETKVFELNGKNVSLLPV